MACQMRRILAAVAVMLACTTPTAAAKCKKDCNGELSEYIPASAITGEWVVGMVSRSLKKSYNLKKKCYIIDVYPENSCNITVSGYVDATVYSPMCGTKGECMPEDASLYRNSYVELDGGEGPTTFSVVAHKKDYMIAAFGGLDTVVVYVKDVDTMPSPKIAKALKKYTTANPKSFEVASAKKCYADSEYEPEGYCSRRRTLFDIDA